MKIDGGLMGDLAKAGQSAKKLEALGYQGAITAETSHDPFFRCCWQRRKPKRLN